MDVKKQQKTEHGQNQKVNDINLVTWKGTADAKGIFGPQPPC